MEQVISIKPAQRIGIAASCPFDKSTKEIPYNQYIYFNDLAGLWSKHLNREERILQAGFISIELTARLIETTIDSNREPENKNKIIEFLNDAILKQLDLLLSLNLEKLSNSIHTSNVASDSLNIEGLRFLDDKYAPFIDAFTGKYNLLSKKAGVEIGLGRQVNAIRAHYNLPALKSDFTQQLDYQKLVPSFKIALLKNSKAFNNEDEVFMTIHQISECWLYLAVSELNIIIEQFSKHGLKNNCTKHFSFTSSVLQYVSHHILALEGMVLANYHPLRVALRGASGGQSQQAHKTFGLAIHVYRLFQTIIEAEDISILTILENPVIFKNHNSTISSLTELERSLQNFYFQHYKLSCSVIGSQSFGSIGFDLATLAKKFTEPLFVEIDNAKYDFTLKTNFKYGAFAGKIILEKENFEPVTASEYTGPQSIMVAKSIMDKTIGKYFGAISSLQANDWCNLFAEEGYIEDPAGSRPFIGQKELAIFFKGVQRMFAELKMTIVEKTLAFNSATVKWQAEAVGYNGRKLYFNGTENFYFNREGQIVAAQVEWDPSVISDQL